MDNINYSEIRKFNSSDQLMIFLKDPSLVLDTEVVMKKKMNENILIRTGTPSPINLMLLAIKPEELVAKIEARIELD